MDGARGAQPDASLRARAWRRAQLASVCDVWQRWPHGFVARTSRYPDYWDFNVVQVEQEPGMSLDRLLDFADEALDGLAHRRIDFEPIDVAERFRGPLEARGWKATRLLWMLHQEPLPPGPEIAVQEVPYDAAAELRQAWHDEDFPAIEATEFHGHAREMALSRGARVLGARRAGEVVAYAQLESTVDGAEIVQVYVRADHRGCGLGTSVTRAAIAAAPERPDLWICADDEDRPKHLYARLGFRPVWTEMQFLRIPG